MEQTVAAHIGQAAGISSQAKKIANELRILRAISVNGWIREYEVHLITGISMHTVSRLCKRLAEEQMIYRESQVPLTKAAKERAAEEQTGTAKANIGCTPYHAGHFLRMKKRGADRVGGRTGKDIQIPECWRHTMLALQTLHFLSCKLGVTYQTEHQIREYGTAGKIPDGALHGKNEYHFEVEFSRKSGKHLHRQSAAIVQKAQAQVRCLIAYPYPAAHCGHDHERSLENSLEYFMTKDKSREQIDFVRCHFNSALDFDRVMPSRFSILTAYPALDLNYERKVEEARAQAQFSWVQKEVRDETNYKGRRIIRIELTRAEGLIYEGWCIERPHPGAAHVVRSDESNVPKGEYDYLKVPIEGQDKTLSFMDFVERKKQQIEMRNLELWLAYEDSDDSDEFP